MDGTLTVAVHDFDAIRRALGVPADEPILEWLDAQPGEQQPALYARLDELELEFAMKATAQSGARELLQDLADRNARLGIVTRNSKAIAGETLSRAGLGDYFDPAYVLGRDAGPAKPSPAGLQRLLSAWGASADQAVMIGDFVYDLEAGSRAGCATVFYDPDRTGQWRSRADVTVTSHHMLRRLAAGDIGAKAEIC